MSSWHPKGVVSLVHEIAQDFGLEHATDRVTLTIITDHGALEVTEMGDGSDHSTIRLKDVAGDVHLIQEHHILRITVSPPGVPQPGKPPVGFIIEGDAQPRR